MGEIGKRLDGFLVGYGSDLVQQKGQDDRHRKAEDDTIDADYQRIPENPEEKRIFEYGLEMLEVVPGTPEYSVGVSKILESHQDTVDRYVFKYDQKDDGNNEQEIVVPHPPGSRKELFANGEFYLLSNYRLHRSIPYKVSIQIFI